MGKTGTREEAQESLAGTVKGRSGLVLAIKQMVAEGGADIIKLLTDACPS